MHYVVIAHHSAEVCPTSNAKTKALLLELAPQIPTMAEKNSVAILAGPFTSREHTVVTIVEAERPEALDAFMVDSQLSLWNEVRIIPSLTMEASMRELQEGTTLF
jgi:hypothetical protein